MSTIRTLMKQGRNIPFSIRKEGKDNQVYEVVQELDTQNVVLQWLGVDGLKHNMVWSKDNYGWEWAARFASPEDAGTINDLIKYRIAQGEPAFPFHVKSKVVRPDDVHEVTGWAIVGEFANMRWSVNQAGNRGSQDARDPYADFYFNPSAQEQPYSTPSSAVILGELVEYMRGVHIARGTPHLPFEITTKGGRTVYTVARIRATEADLEWTDTDGRKSIAYSLTGPTPFYLVNPPRALPTIPDIDPDVPEPTEGDRLQAFFSQSQHDPSSPWWTGEAD